MMHGHDHRALEVVGLDLIQLSRQVRDLCVADAWVRTVLARDHTGVFEHVAIESDDADERRIEGEIHTRLNHSRPAQASRFGQTLKRAGAEDLLKRLQAA